jgi:hypothetical protein
MLLGQVLQQLGDAAFAAETLIGLDDLPLLADLETMREQFDESAPDYVIGAVRRFAYFASDDDWLALTTALERSDDPGAACLRNILAWSLRHDREHASHACGCGEDCQGSSV